MTFRGYDYIKGFRFGEPKFAYGYHCAHCNHDVSGLVAALYDTKEGWVIKWLLCPNCGDGSVLTKQGYVYPTPVIAPDLEGLPDDIKDAYLEARRCFSIKAPTACELICRKILMHVAVEKGAKAEDTFENYIKYLESQGYITKTMKPWVDLIRQHGNNSTHKLETPDPERAESTLMFTVELLKVIYDMAYKANKYTKTT